jgi:lipopolysaccharide export system permease protein
MRCILERYIAKTMLLATGLASLILIGIVLLMSLLAEFKNIGEGDYGLSQAFLYVFLQLPNTLYQFSPIFILLGSMLGFYYLSAQNELAVMRASGFSLGRIIYSALCAAIILIISITLVGEGIGPSLSYRAEINKENAQNAGLAVVTAAGMWLHVDNNFIHIEHVVNRRLLEGVTRYQFDAERRLQAAYFAKTLTMHNNAWIMHDVMKTNFYFERTKSEALKQAPWDLKFNANLLNTGLVAPKDLSLPKLAKFSRYLLQNGLQASEYQFNFWQRLLEPLSSLVMVLVAIPFVLGLGSAVTLSFRLLIGMMMGIAFILLNAFLGELCIVYQLPAPFAALITPLIFASLGIFLLKRLNI